MGVVHNFDEGSRVAQVANVIRQRITGHALTPGAKLPSIRGFAQTMSVSTSTVVEAYDRLVSEGFIQPRRGSGFFVTRNPQPLTLAQIGPRLDRAVDPFWVSRQSLEAGIDMHKPGCGWLPASWMPEAELRRALRNLSRAEPVRLADYATPLGHPSLRQILSMRLGERGVVVPAEQIMLTDSGTQAIDMLCRLLIEPGDTVLVDDPCYFNFLALLRAHRVDIVGVPHTPDGPDLVRFQEALRVHRPRLYITNSAIHNPTGARLSPVTAHRLLKHAEQAGLTIVEDDIFCDFEDQAAPRLSAFDGLERVIQIGSFSKTLTAAARCGYIAARSEWIERLIDLKIATTFSGHQMSSEVVYAVLKDGSYRRHVTGLRDRLAGEMEDVRRRLQEKGLVPWIDGNGGMFVWCALPDGLESADVARHALEQGVVMAPGNVFSVSQSAGSFLRFNVAQCGDPRIFDILARSMDACAVKKAEPAGRA